MKELLFIFSLGVVFLLFMKFFILSPSQERFIEVGHCYVQKGYHEKIVVTDKMKYGFKYRVGNVIKYSLYDQYNISEMDCYD